jgi:putative nucleotidyltransferase with HDIG domain
VNRLTLDQVVGSLRDLPSLPLIVTTLLRSFGQTDVSLSELAAQLSKDPALSAKTLRLANSSFYGLQSKVRTIEQAIAVLGFDSMRALVTSAGIIDSLPGKGGSFDFTAFWRHSVSTALCARSLAKIAGCNQDFAFISGLLHDIGLLVLVHGFPHQYGAVVAHRLATDCDVLEAELTVLGLDHAMVGGALARHWNFPPLIQRTIAHHHAPHDADLGDIPSVIYVADAIVHGLDLAGQPDEPVPTILQSAWDSLRIDSAGLRRVLVDTESAYADACQILTATA